MHLLELLLSPSVKLIVAASIALGYVTLIVVRPIQVCARTSPAERLFARSIGLGLIMVGGREAALRAFGGVGNVVDSAGYHVMLLVFAFYQDVLIFGLVTWIFCRLCTLTAGTRLATIAYITGCSLSILLAVYVTLGAYASGLLSVSYKLLSTPGVFGEVGRSLVDSVTAFKLLELIAATLVVVLAPSILCDRTPLKLDRTYRFFLSPLGAALLAGYCVVGAVIWNTRVDRDAVSNPAWSLVSSLVDPGSPTLEDRFPVSYLADFAPSIGNQTTRAFLAAHSLVGRQSSSRQAPLNVLMIVMESVGSRRLQVSGASYPDSPELLRLADHAFSFSRIYASVPQSSDAMAALVCSVYPYHYWQSTTSSFPGLRLPCLPQVLTSHGYRTAFLHSGGLAFDLEGQFLRRHGFTEVLDDIGQKPSSFLSAQTDMPRDPALFSAAIHWITQDTSRPFFLTIWTDDTHNPYTSVRHENYGVSDPSLNRYLNSVRATDELIGNLVDELRKIGCTENTLIVVTGDHGEAFHEHGHQWHGFTVYDEEVRVPLMFINPKLFSTALKNSAVGEQLDIAPTILHLLGYGLPAGWQGRSLFAPTKAERAYLFDMFLFRFGLVQGNLKYIYDAESGRGQIYDLASDPLEHHDLEGDAAYLEREVEAQRRIAAWFAFQNSYLKRLGESDTSVILNTNHPK